MKKIWAPWRMKYIEIAKDDKLKGCILCGKPKEDKDAENQILYRNEKTFVMMNRFPYNPGHLMVAPYRHVAKLEDLTDEERNELFATVSKCVVLLRKLSHPDGFNIGVNLGRVAGAGIEDHIHAHIVPRWQGDTNFMPVVADIRVVPEALADTYNKLKKQISSTPW